MFYFSQQVKVILSVECLFLDYSTLLLGGRDLVKQEEIGSEWSDMFLLARHETLNYFLMAGSCCNLLQAKLVFILTVGCKNTDISNAMTRN